MESALANFFHKSSRKPLDIDSGFSCALKTHAPAMSST
jgi:hypothetical protein